MSIPQPLQDEEFFLVDRSLSAGESCVALGRRVREILASSAGSSKWTFFATGTAATAYEPIAIAVDSVPARERLLDDKEIVDQHTEKFVDDVIEACKKIPAADVSPIFLGVKDVIAQARRRADKAHVYVHIISDLEETIEKSIREALTQAPGMKSELPDPIDTRDIALDVCGYAETFGYVTKEGKKVLPAPRTAQSAERLLEVWTGRFTDRARVTYTPFCN